MTKALVISRRGGLLQGLLAGPLGPTLQVQVRLDLAEAVLDAPELDPDLVLVDIPTLPQAHWPWLDLLRPRAPHASVVAVITEQLPGLRRLFGADLDGFLLDPFDLQQVHATLLRALQRRSAPRDSATRTPSSRAPAELFPGRETDPVEALAQFLKGLAHEVNNPLASVLGILQVMQADTEDEVLSSRFTTLKSELDRIQVTLRELEYFVKVRKPNRKLLDVANLVAELQEEYAVVLESELPEASVLGDADQLRTALQRLAALAAGPAQGEVRIQLEADTAEVRIWLEGSPGSDLPDDPMTLFLPYHETPHQGYLESLRLAACHGIVRGHRGRLRAERIGEDIRIELALPSAERTRSGPKDPKTED